MTDPERIASLEQERENLRESLRIHQNIIDGKSLRISELEQELRISRSVKLTLQGEIEKFQSALGSANKECVALYKQLADERAEWESQLSQLRKLLQRILILDATPVVSVEQWVAAINKAREALETPSPQPTTEQK